MALMPMVRDIHMYHNQCVSGSTCSTQSSPCLVQVGEFYETMGIDAVLLVQHAGLNPMAQGDPPRAGCPVANLRRTISDLVEQAGLSVVSV